MTSKALLMSTVKNKPATKEYKQSVKLMGNIFEITVVAEGELWAEEKINAAINEIRRIEAVLTTFNEESETNHINRHAGIKPVRVNEEVFELIKRSIHISRITDGAFDITYGSVDKQLWNFDKHMTALPDAATAKERVRLINYRNIILDETTHSVMLREQGMRIGFGGIGKGYAAEKAKELLINQGVENGIINASGDLAAWGLQANGQPWTIGVSNPDKPAAVIASLNISNKAIATSGNYEKYVLINSKKYSHTIDPKTGLPVSGIKSVTVIAPHAEIADALATPVTIMGIKTGINLINQLPGIECIIIDDFNHIYCSKNIHLQ